MKHKLTPIAEGSQETYKNITSLFNNGVNDEGESISVSDALTLPDAGNVFKRAIEEIIIRPVQPNLVGTRLIKTTFVDNPGTVLNVRTLGATSRIEFLVAEEGEYPEISAAAGNSSKMELRFSKYGCKFKISEELLEHSTWELISHQITEVVNAMARYRDAKIMEMLFGRGVVVFDNTTPAQSVFGRTTGRDITGAGNGSLTHENLIDMYSVVVANGYTPNVLLCHPMHWTAFAKDPLLRETGILQGNLNSYLKSGMYNDNPYQGLPDFGNARKDLDTTELTERSTAKLSLPSYSPLTGLTIITSPLVPFNPDTRTGHILLLDTDNSGLLAFSELLNLEEWDEKRNDLKVIKLREKWALDVIDNGKAIAVARNISAQPNEVVINPQVTITNPAPIPSGK